MNIGRNNQTLKLGTKFNFNNNISNNEAIKEVGSLEIRSIPHCEAYQCCGFPTQAPKFYENRSNVSCFLIGTLPHIYHSKKYS